MHFFYCAPVLMCADGSLLWPPRECFVFGTAACPTRHARLHVHCLGTRIQKNSRGESSSLKSISIVERQRADKQKTTRQWHNAMQMDRRLDAKPINRHFTQSSGGIAGECETPSLPWAVCAQCPEQSAGSAPRMDSLQ